ncbi:MAG: hypothetical protein IT430_07500 [Phycisphaerales bacterium]|nr:hypothetical protein [Phycisphaerales bacterium]
MPKEIVLFLLPQASFWAIVAALIVLSLGAVLRAVCTPKFDRGAARCGQCRHEIIDVTSGICPECGGRLVSVGLHSRRSYLQSRGSLPGLIFAWSVLFLTVGLVGFETAGPGTSVADWLGVPEITRNSCHGSLYPYDVRDQYTGRPNRDKTNYLVEIYSDYLGSPDGPLAGVSTITFRSYNAGEMRLDHSTEEIDLIDSTGNVIVRRERLITPDQFANIIRVAAPGISDEQLATDSRGFVQFVSELVAKGPDWNSEDRQSANDRWDHVALDGEPVFKFSGGGWSRSGFAPMFSRRYGITKVGYIYASAGLVWFAIYLLSLFALVRRRSKLLHVA